MRPGHRRSKFRLDAQFRLTKHAVFILIGSWDYLGTVICISTGLARSSNFDIAWVSVLSELSVLDHPTAGRYCAFSFLCVIMHSAVKWFAVSYE